MAGKTEVENLQAAVSTLKSIDRSQLLRPNLGVESLEVTNFGRELDEFTRQAEFALEYAPQVHNDQVNQVRKIVDGVNGELSLQVNRSNKEYVNLKDAFLGAVRNYIEELRIPRPYFITTAIESRGLLHDEGIQKEYERVLEQMHDNAESTLKMIQEESENTIAKARKFAEQIEERARRTATQTSVEAAQKQFKDAQAVHEKQVKVWGWLSGGSILLFVVSAVFFGFFSTVPSQTTGEAIYHTAIRITLLTALGAVATFCLRILRAHLHMQQHNLHRQRVTNSIAAFVESAVTPEQRDLILAQLVDAVVGFGSTGLLPDLDDNVAPTKLAIDSITRNIITPPK